MQFSIVPQLIIETLGAIVTQAVAFGILNSGIAQTIIAIGGIVIPAAFAIASALHAGHVHAAQVNAKTFGLPSPGGGRRVGS